MKKSIIITIIVVIAIIVLGVVFMLQASKKNKVTKDMAYQGVYNYCHSTYDWSIAEDNPSIMYVEMGDETKSEYQVIFRSYTGAFVYFHVDKSTWITKLVEHVPTIDVENEAGTINIFDYLNDNN